MASKAPFNPGPATRAKGVGFYGHHRLGKARKQFRVNLAHAQALREEAERGRREGA